MENPTEPKMEMQTAAKRKLRTKELHTTRNMVINTLRGRLGCADSCRRSVRHDEATSKNMRQQAITDPREAALAQHDEGAQERKEKEHAEPNNEVLRPRIVQY